MATAAPSKTIDSTTSTQSIATTKTQATRIERFLACLIDAAIMIVVSIPVSFVLAAMGLYSMGFVSTLLSMAVSVVIFVAINYKFLKENGQTIGKKLMKIKIVSQQTEEILPVNEVLLKRYAPIFGVGIIPIVGAILALVDACMIFRQSQLCFHDDLAKTTVVNA